MPTKNLTPRQTVAAQVAAAILAGPSGAAILDLTDDALEDALDQMVHIGFVMADRVLERAS